MKFKDWLLNQPTLLLLALPLVGCGGSSTTPSPGPPPPSPTLSLSTVVNGLSNPVDLQQPSDGTNRFFVVEQSGTIRIISNGALLPTNFLDISGKVHFDGGEMGLLGLAFHPAYSSNRRFFVNYNPNLGTKQTYIAEYKASAGDPNQADPASERILLVVNQEPNANHKGGQLAFGPDGFLYIGLGDGGGSGDPAGNGQNLFTLLGKVLRIDVDKMDPGLQYAIPPGNPFTGGLGLPEIWAYGLRNPWRFSFERGSGRLFSADVGQDNWEEVDLLQKGANFGWNVMEGAHCYPPGSSCNMSGKILPITEYDHSEGEAVIGGYVYKGNAIPSLAGMYIFADLNGKMWSLSEGPPDTWTRTPLLTTGRTITSFGQDAAGEVYVVDYSGIVLKLVLQ